MVTPKKGKNYYCTICDYICSKKYDWTRHLITAKHKIDAFGDKTVTPKRAFFKCENCPKTYSSRNGIWLHRKKCSEPVIPEINVINTNVDANLILSVVQQNQDFQKQMFEMMKESMKESMISHNHNTITNCNNTTTTNNNNKFNLNFFLNETCKDAMNIKDFVASLQLQLHDLEYAGENGYAAGITNIILRELKQLDVCKRPIHCSDLKREVLHIKEDNKWERERNHFIRAIKELTRKNVCLLQEWREAHPGCDKYHHMLLLLFVIQSIIMSNNKINALSRLLPT